MVARQAYFKMVPPDDNRTICITVANMTSRTCVAYRYLIDSLQPAKVELPGYAASSLPRPPFLHIFE